MTYFACFGYHGIIGMVLACTLIAFCGAKALLAVRQNSIQDPHMLNVAAGGKIFGSVLTVCCGLFSYSAYIIMLAGIRQICGGSLGAVIAISVCAYIVLYRGFGTLAKICGICAPVIAVLIGAVALLGSFSGDGAAVSDVVYTFSPVKMIIKSFLYAGYNVLTSICVLGRCLEYLEKKSTAVWGGILGGIMVFLSAGCVFIALIHGGIAPDLYDMPVLALFTDGGIISHESVIFQSVLLVAMILSAITGLTGTCVFFTRFLPERKMGILLGLLAIPATFVSFGQLMDILYPIFGFAGIFLMFVLALMGDKNV